MTNCVERNAFVGKIRTSEIESVKKIFELSKDDDEPKKLLNYGVYLLADFIIIYSESLGKVCPEAVFGKMDFLEQTGMGGEKLVAMETIFYYNKPKGPEHWARKTESEAVGCFGKIKPGLLSSYVYYHYILQETTKKARDKYGVIFEFQNYLFYYKELPSEKEFPSYEGHVNGEIPENWNELMDSHFILWEENSRPWKNMERII